MDPLVADMLGHFKGLSLTHVVSVMENAKSLTLGSLSTHKSLQRTLWLPSIAIEKGTLAGYEGTGLVSWPNGLEAIKCIDED